MPTFQTIRIHPQLHQRLVTESSSSGECQVIETPQALLSRNPAHLRLLNEEGVPQPLALPVVQKLRHEVANALIEQSETGKRVREIQEAIKRSVKTKGGEDNASEFIDNDDDDDLDDIQMPSNTISFPGFVTLQQLVTYDDLLRTSSKAMHISTGCPTLDGWWNNDPRGLVTQIAGPSSSGKTQLVLQLLARSSEHDCQYWSSCPALRPLAKRFQELCHNNLSATCDNVTFLTIHDEYDLLQRLNQLEDDNIPDVLVIDSLSTCLTNVEYHDGKMRQQITGTLRSVAQHYNIAIFIVNGTVGASQTNSTILGDDDDNDGEEDEEDIPSAHRAAVASSYKAAFSWLKAEDISIWMEACPSRTFERRLVQVRMDRHPTRKVGRNEAITVRIDSAGVTEVSSAK